MLNLEPVRNEIEFQWLNCVDDTVATVAKYYGMEYRFAYLDTWDFLYRPLTSSERVKLGNRIDIMNVIDRYGYYEKYHKIKLDWHYTDDANEILRNVKAELSANRPVSIRMDSYFLPWSAQYKKWHNNHVCMPVEIDENKGIFTVIDPYFKVVDQHFPISLLKEASGFYITYDVDVDNNESFDMRSAFRNRICDLLNGDGNRSAFKNMRAFADDFLHNFSPEVEFDNSEGGFYGGTLHDSISFLVFGRSFFRSTVKCMAEREKNDDLLQLSMCFRRMLSKWNIITSLMQRTFRGENKDISNGTDINNDKSVFKTDYEKTIQSVHKLLLEEADYEEQTAEKLLQILDSLGKTPKAYHSDIEQDKGRPTGPHTEFLDIEKYFNNKAFGSLEAPYTADFTGYGEFLLHNNFPKKGIWTAEDMDFRLVDVQKAGYDNISCIEQVITFDEVWCNKICILAAAEWASYFELIKVFDADGNEEEVNLGVSDFAYNPRFEDKIVWTGKSAEVVGGTAKVLKEKAKIFKVSCDLAKAQKVCRIQLPACKNIHIFAITLLLSE